MHSQTQRMKLRNYLTSGTILVVLAGVIFISGCGGSSGNDSAPDPNAAEVSPPGDIPDNQAFVPFTPPGADYTVSVPEGWSKTVSADATTFTDKLNSIEVTDSKAKSAPSTSTVEAEVPNLTSTIPGFTNPQVSTVTRSAGDAVLLTYEATAKTDPVTGKSGTDAVERYTFFQNGETVTLTLSGPKGADNVDPWMIVTDSLKWN